MKNEWETREPRHLSFIVPQKRCKNTCWIWRIVKKWTSFGKWREMVKRQQLKAIQQSTLLLQYISKGFLSWFVCVMPYNAQIQSILWIAQNLKISILAMNFMDFGIWTIWLQNHWFTKISWFLSNKQSI